MRWLFRVASVASAVVPVGILLWYVLTHDHAHGAAVMIGAVVGVAATRWHWHRQAHAHLRDVGYLRSLALAIHMLLLRVRPRAVAIFDGVEVTADRTDATRFDAKFLFLRGKYDLAIAQARTAMLMFGCLSADDPAWDGLCATFAELMLQFGRPEACDRLMQLSLAHSRVRGNELGCREMFYAQFLFAQGRLAEAEHHAIEAIRAPFGEVGFAHELLAKIRAASSPSVRRR